MRPLRLIAWALPASTAVQGSSLSPARTSENDLSLNVPSLSITSPPIQTSPTSTSLDPQYHFATPLADDLLDYYMHNDLVKRQGPVVTQAPPAVPTVVTQVPPETVYTIYSVVGGSAQAVNIPYTQLFSAVPDQWSSPAAGTIGLGTIAGPIGVVKTSKRNFIPGPTATPGQILRIKGREVTLP